MGKKIFICPQCNTVNKSENNFCQKCGKSLEGVELQEVKNNKTLPLWADYIIYIFVLTAFVFGFVALYYAIVNDNLGNSWDYISSTVAWVLGPIVALTFVLSIWCILKFKKIEKRLINIQDTLQELKSVNK